MNGLKEWTLLLSGGVVGVDGSEGVGVRACRPSSRSSSVSDIGERGCRTASAAVLLARPGDRAPGAVFERFNGRGRWRAEGCSGLGTVLVLSGGKIRRR